MSKMSEHESKMLGLQMQMRQNNADLHSFVSELDGWEQEMKQLDSSLKDKGPAAEKKLPPVRNSLDKKKRRKVKKSNESESAKAKAKRISGYDYRSWDKFDVDKACESADDENSDSEYETDEEWEVERKKQAAVLHKDQVRNMRLANSGRWKEAAVLHKDQGNEYFKKGSYNEAIECYTKGAEQDPTNPLLPANRAMALLKQNKFGAAELDCSVALVLDPLYTKAYLRRGTARMGLQKFEEAKLDYERVLQLEPQNKKAKSDLEQIDKELAKGKLVTHTEPSVDKNLGVVKAISKPPHERSKKPLRRIEIEEVGLEDDHERRSAVSRIEASQGEQKRGIVEKEAELFQRFTATSPAEISLAAVQNRDSQESTGIKSSSSPADVLSLAAAQNQGSQASAARGQIPSGEQSVSVSDSVCDTENAQSRVERLTLDNNLGDTNQGGSGTSSRQARDTTPAAPTSTSPRELSVPSSSFQFQADYKIVKNKPEAFYQYFKKITPSDYPKLFGQFLDSDVLLRILNIIKDFYIPNGEVYLDTLQHLATVKRFSMVAMFLSKAEKQVLSDIFSHLRSSGQYSEESINSVASKYDMR